jgi:hypothetical protein
MTSSDAPDGGAARQVPDWAYGPGCATELGGAATGAGLLGLRGQGCTVDVSVWNGLTANAPTGVPDRCKATAQPGSRYAGIQELLLAEASRGLAAGMEKSLRMGHSLGS